MKGGEGRAGTSVFDVIYNYSWHQTWVPLTCIVDTIARWPSEIMEAVDNWHGLGVIVKNKAGTAARLTEPLS